MTTRAHVRVSGTVQGVTFRASTKRAAEDLGVSGWVQNLPDVTGEAVFEGPEDAVAEMISFCHVGPAAAAVEDVTVDYKDPAGIEGFEIRR